MWYETRLFVKVECLVKLLKMFFEKNKWLTSTYKSGSLKGKLSKRTMYI